MNDKVVNLFSKQPLNSESSSNEIEETIQSLVELKDSLKDIIILAVTKEEELYIRSSDMTRETAYYLLGLAKLNALTQ